MKKTINEVKYCLLENRLNEKGNLDLRGLDFSDFNGNVSVGAMKVKKHLFQDGQEVGKTLFQDSQKVKGNLYQLNQNVEGSLYQEEIKSYTKNEIEAILGYKIIIKE